jgi:hypothetical protein
MPAGAEMQPSILLAALLLVALVSANGCHGPRHALLDDVKSCEDKCFNRYKVDTNLCSKEVVRRYTAIFVQAGAPASETVSETVSPGAVSKFRSQALRECMNKDPSLDKFFSEACKDTCKETSKPPESPTTTASPDTKAPSDAASTDTKPSADIGAADTKPAPDAVTADSKRPADSELNTEDTKPPANPAEPGLEEIHPAAEDAQP